MTRLRVVALAQVLTILLLLLPGPLPAGLSPVVAAVRPTAPDQATVYDVTGKGIGCQTGKRYKGPKLPKDPPWPPGAEPTPTPEPVPSVSPSAPSPTDSTMAANGAAGPSASPTTEPQAAEEYGLVRFDATRSELEASALFPVAASSAGGLVSGIDVSHHQQDLDFEAVRSAGHRFALLKVTENNEHVDTYFATYVEQARAAGLAVGAYHVFDYSLDGTEQADHYVDRVEAVSGFEGLLPPIVDVECWGDYYGASIHSLSAARLRDFVEEVYRRTGRLPVVYTSQHMWHEVVGDAAGFDDLPLWAACWSCQEPVTLPAGWDDWTFWQEGLTKIPGRRAKVDGNYFRGTVRDLAALRLRPFAVAAGAPTTSGGQVALDLGGRDAARIRTSLDGETWTGWRPVGAMASVDLPAQDGPQTVYAQFRDPSGTRSPVVSDTIVVDATPPELSDASLALRAGPLAEGGAMPMTMTWQASDALSRLADASVTVRCDGADARQDPAPGSAAPGATVTWNGPTWLAADASCTVTATAPDAAGNTGSVSAAPVTLGWLPAGGDAAVVEADELGLIARRGPDGGRAAVLIDGETVGLIDLYAPEPGAAEIVYVVQLDGGPHSVAVDATGTADPSSTGTALDIDGYATLKR